MALETDVTSLPGGGDGDSIFEQMVLSERRALAAELGVRVCDLEEAENLERTLEVSSREQHQSTAAASSSSSSLLSDEDVKESSPEAAEKKVEEDEADEEDEDESKFATITAAAAASRSFSALPIEYTRLTPEQQQCSKWWLLPQELADRITVFVGSVDMLGYLNMLAKTNGLRPSDMAYRFACEDTYPRLFGPTTKLLIENWGGSWRNMLIHRPRIRTNGFYTLRTLYSKAPTNDSFDPKEKILGSIETVYFRHFRFFFDGRVLYSPSLHDPWDTSDRLFKAKPIDKQIFVGSYSAKGRIVNVSLPMHYCTMLFELQILDGCDSYSNYPGKHSVLRILRHAQLLPGPHSQECAFPLPISCDLRFWREDHFNPTQPINS